MHCAFFRGRQGPRHSCGDRRGDLRERKRAGYVVRAREKRSGRAGEQRKSRTSARPEGPTENRRETRVEEDQVRRGGMRELIGVGDRRRRIMSRDAGLAQLVEQLICNQLVGGSTPLPGTIKTAS